MPPPLRNFARWVSLHPYWIVIPVAIFACFFRLGSHRLESIDEGLYAQMAREMALGGDWLTMHWTGTPWFGKPPLFMWLTAAAYKVFGVNEFSSRLPSSLCGVGIIALSFAIVRRVMPGSAAFYTAAILCTSSAFLNQARFCTTDAVLAFAFIAAIYVHLRWGARGLSGVAFCFAVAYMDKSAAACLVFLPLLPSVLAAQWREKDRMPRRLVTGLGVLLVVILPWHLLMYHWYGNQFLSENLSYHVIKRITQKLEGNQNGPGYYLWALNYYMTGHYSLLLLLIPPALWRMPAAERRKLAILFIPPFAIMALLMVPETRLFWYLYPAIPLFAAALACAVAWTFRSRDKLLLSCFGILALASLGNDTGPTTLFLLLILTTAAAVVSWLRPGILGPAVAATALLLLALASVTTLRSLASTTPTESDRIADLSAQARPANSADHDPVFVLNPRIGNTAVFYTGRSWCIELEDFDSLTLSKAELNRCLGQHPTLHAFIASKNLALLQDDPRARVIAKSGNMHYVRIDRASPRQQNAVNSSQVR